MNVAHIRATRAEKSLKEVSFLPLSHTFVVLCGIVSNCRFTFHEKNIVVADEVVCGVKIDVVVKFPTSFNFCRLW